MDFEWDYDKARINEDKHGVSFAEASEVIVYVSFRQDK